ncbi:MAG: MFS transporter, partial [Firmicutes bacterium]|nr:MFS transporter [Bacillota bacterium]
MKGKTMMLLAALGTVPFIMVLGNSMLIPVLPQMQKELGISQFQTSLVISLFSVPAGLVIPFAGFLSDRIGRKKVIAPSLIIYGIGGLIAGIAALLLQKAYWVIIAGRIIQGIGAAGTAPVAMALVGDIFTSQE